MRGKQGQQACYPRLVLELRDKEDIYPLAIGYDPWHVSDELIKAFEEEFGKGVLVPVRQGVITLSDPMKT